jgi:hypothetical protein
MENPAPKDATWQVSKVPPGSIKTVACVKRSGKMNRFCKVGTLNSGGPESAPAEAARQPRDDCDQRQEDAVMTLRESDPPIVVRDGNTGHKAKERAGKQRKHRYLHGTRILPNQGVKLPACNGNRFWHHVSALVPCARFPEEPGAVIPHAGICEGGVEQSASLPQ